MNTFGNTFRLTTFGESHGNAVGGIIDGCPAGWVIDKELVERFLLRRRVGDEPSALTTARREVDEVEWLSGIYVGKTLGTPIAFALRNRDCRSDDYQSLRDCCRPGHADYTYQQKYGFRDHRGGGRASGRETASRVVAGAVAMQLLSHKGIQLSSLVEGHQVKCAITGVPAGIGEPVFDKLNARLAFAMFSIPSSMSFVMGESADDYRLDQMSFPDAWVAGGSGDTLTFTNHCGGVQGGISNGMPIVFHVGFHLPVTQPDGMVCRREDGSLVSVAPGGRHDVSHLTRLPVIVESMAAITILDMMMSSNNQIFNMKD